MDTFTNNATLSYTFDGSAGTLTAQSNDVTTTLLNCYGCAIEKYAAPETYRLGEPVTFLVLLTNTGSKPLCGLCFVDNLGAEEECTPPLTYVPGSARLIIGDVVTPLTPSHSGSGLRFTLPDPLAVDSTAVVVYAARVACQLPAPLPCITNTVTICCETGSCSGSDSATVCPEQYADVCITKQADQESVCVGDTLNYTLLLRNSGTLPAEDIRIEDILPANIATVDAVYLSVGGDTETPTTDYSFHTGTRLFTLPVSGALSVPAATDAGPGTLQVRIQATIGA